MYSAVSADMIAHAMELICFISTAVAAFVSYIVMLRF